MAEKLLLTWHWATATHSLIFNDCWMLNVVQRQMNNISPIYSWRAHVYKHLSCSYNDICILWVDVFSTTRKKGSWQIASRETKDGRRCKQVDRRVRFFSLKSHIVRWYTIPILFEGLWKSFSESMCDFISSLNWY
jgi:hypothetical protein